MIAMSDLGKTLMILGFNASIISLKIWLFLRMHSISSEEMCVQLVNKVRDTYDFEVGL